ncbi:probable ATP-dependent RNA helicase DHX34 [Agrilus planipennis]|uniref:Probable ATP-dependent RNA helicase DHX34 n=1 Tax=Agrilus planipennis TaxID=224129 RepID=A0A1W4X6S3_AGRPL|nr:probable ATP-dependent RNA helicase DHX34 [Agrilus planipennis]
MSMKRAKSPYKNSDLESNKKRIKSSNHSFPLERYKYELNKFLQDYGGISKTDDFWKFFEKYQAIQLSKKSSTTYFDKTLLINQSFVSKTSRLYDKIPTLDRHGERMNIPYNTFKDFLQTVLIYQDFQQKTKMAKLKKLRQSQRDLPIAQFKDEIISRLKESRILLIAGDTGCGKSTQVPQYVLEAGYNKTVCTQPRRIACVSLAKRVAYETLTDFKSTVGYQIRFEKSKRADTAIIFMTEGLLLRQAAEEETINQYDVIILDEIHERHLYGDFLIGIMKCLVHKKDNFKLVLMSATINIDLFSNYFKNENIQIVQVPGRLFPIEIQYKPIKKDPYERKASKFDCIPYLEIIQMIDAKYPPNEKGDLLVFLNGFAEISALADAVTEYSKFKKNWIVLQLHSTLSLEEQDKVFDYPPEGVRKCIISTNIAETSVTIDGIRFVIDSGKVNRMTYHTVGGINKLTETNISQDSAKQRAGRAGRTGPGICFRMYSEEDFKNFDAFTTAEIHLVPLESLLLHMISLGLTDIVNFPFLEKPSERVIEESLERLKFYGALQLDEQYLVLTPLGEALSKLPVDLTIGKMLIMSTVFGNVNAVLALAALLSVQSPFTQSAYKNIDTLELRKPLESTHGDSVTFLNLYKEWLSVKYETTPASSSGSSTFSKQKENSRIWAKKRGLEEQRFYEVTKLIQQFKDILEDADLLPKGLDIELTSSERAIRYGELKHLKTLRRQLKEESKSSRKKQLKYDTFIFEGDIDRKEAQKVDIRDVEFRIANDFKKLQKLLDETSPDSARELFMLKLILTGGLYPSVAVEDEFNSSKSVAERLYHTKSKNFVFLRPLSCFTTNPEVLELHADDVEVPPPGYFSKRPLSRKHQLLIFQSILETKKVYLVNVTRMPCVQTLMLFAKTIAVNATLSKFVFDEFLLIDIPYFGQGKTLLLRAIALRKIWKAKLEEKLKDPNAVSRQNNEEIFYFMEDLVKFINTDVCYNVKRLLPADLKMIYTHETEFPDFEKMKLKNPFDPDFSIAVNQNYGGLQVTENVVYDCLVQEEWAVTMEEEISGTPFECPYCKKSKYGYSVYRIIQHEKFCSEKEKGNENVDRRSDKKVGEIKPNSRQFYCENCKTNLILTPTEILRHKRSCKSSSM